jgi:formamidopyrimidine-DNA glycosylase
MSIELPEAWILAEQMNREIRGKRIKSYLLQEHERLQRLGFVNKDVSDFNRLINGKIEAVSSRGLVIRVKLDNGMNLLLAPEYGGRVLYHADESTVQEKAHLKVDFTDNTALTVRLTGMGLIYAAKDDQLERVYVYRRDFSEVASPIDEKALTFERFSELLSEKKTMMLKPLLVGKDAVVVGLGNSAYQDIIYRAKIHPKRRAHELSEEERNHLFDAIKQVLQERIRLGGKPQFLDLYGKQGNYTPAIGPNMAQKPCPICGTPIEKLGLGGGYVYFCPKCQK